MARIILLLICSFFFFLDPADGNVDDSDGVDHMADVHPLLLAPRNLPGVRLRILPKAINYLNKIAANLLAEQLPRLVIPDVQHFLPNDQGAIYISHVRLSRFRRAAYHNISTSAPNKISWTMQNLDLGLIGDLSGSVNIVVPINLTGQVEIMAEGLTFHLESSIEKGDNGSGKVTSLSCMTTIRELTVTNHNGGLFGLAVQVFKQGVSDNVRQLLQGIICKKVRKYIDEDANEKLHEAQTTSRLADALASNSLNMFNDAAQKAAKIDLSTIFDPNITSQFFIDFRLKEQPICAVNSVELASWGEISYQGMGNTPFGPVDSSWPSITRARHDDNPMVELVVSDFLPNSLLYHTYTQNLIRVLLTPKTKGLESFLQTSCEGTFCLSDLAPQLAEQYPNSTIELAVTATRAPAVLFSEKNRGTISMSIGGLIVVFVVHEGRRKQVMVVDMDVVADAKLALSGNNVSGSVELRKFDLKKRIGNIDISDAEIDDIALLVSKLAEELLNSLLSKGLPLPLPRVLRIQNSKVEVLSRRMHITVDVEIDERRLSRLAAKTFFKSPQFTPIVDTQRRMVRPMVSTDPRRPQLNLVDLNNWSVN